MYIFIIIGYNGLRGGADNKLEKMVEMIIDRKIHGYCLQETWQLGLFTTTTRGHKIFHHVIVSQPNVRGQNRAGVMIILEPDLIQA